MRKTLLSLLFTAFALHAQPEGIFQGWDGEFQHVTSQLIALAEATPADKFTWRPAPGVRSMSEVYMHIAVANLFLLSRTGPQVAGGIDQNTEKKVTSKAEVIDWLKRSFDAIRKARPQVKASDWQRKVKVFGDTEGTIESVYLRIIVHNNEHMGQLIAYARMNGIVPPWSATAQ